MSNKLFQRICITLLVLVVSICLLINLIPPSAKSNIHDDIMAGKIVTEGLEYRWGDSPRQNGGTPLWVMDDSDPGWTPLKPGSRPESDGKSEIIWLRLKLPENSWEEPGLYFEAFFQNFDAYYQGKLLYASTGKVMNIDSQKSLGYGWYVIRIKPYLKDEYIYLRVHSQNSKYLGVLRNIMLDDMSNYYFSISKLSMSTMVLAFFYIIIGIIMVVYFFLRKMKEHLSISLGFFWICIGVLTITFTGINQLFFNKPVFWFYVYIAAIYLSPVGLTAFLTQLFKSSIRPPFRYAWLIFIIYTLGTFTFDLLGILPLYLTMPFFFILDIAVLMYLLTVTIKAAIRGNFNARFMLLGLMLSIAATVYDILGAYLHVLPWKANTLPWGILFFTLSLAIILGRNYAKNYHKLKDYATQIEVKNESLNKMWSEVKESKDEVSKRNMALEERTRELESANNKLTALLETLKQAQDHLVQSEKMAALGNLVSGIAHEINTPLGIGVTAASFLNKKTSEFSELYTGGSIRKSDLEEYLKTMSETISIVESNLQRSSELVKSFKQVAVDQSSEVLRTFNVKKYLAEILFSLRPKLKKTNIDISVNCDDELEITSYPGAISQIVTNFIVNSLIHAYDADAKGDILIDVYTVRDKLVIKYSDDGKGIRKEIQDKIFDPFFTTDRSKGGTGLGLHVVYNIVTQTLNGNIKCRSTLGKGTTFIIDFPLKEDSRNGK